MKRLFMWALLVVELAPICLVTLAISNYFFSSWRKKNEAESRYMQAINDGDPEEGLRQLKIYEKYAIKYDRSIKRSDEESTTKADVLRYESICREMMKEYPKALELQQELRNVCGAQARNVEFNVARLHYKNGEKKEAFTEYCAIAKKVLNAPYNKNHKEPLIEPEYVSFDEIDDATRYKRWNSTRLNVTLENARQEAKLTAFLEYDDFLQFMEEEFTELGEPEEFEDEMKFFRDIELNKEQHNDAL